MTVNNNPAREPDLELPLLELFYRLREAHLPLGIAEYELLPKAMLAGFGFGGVESLRRLCLMLWIKSPEEEVIFNHVFAQFLKQRPRSRPVTDQTGEPDEVDVTNGDTLPPKEGPAEEEDDRNGADKRVKAGDIEAARRELAADERSKQQEARETRRGSGPLPGGPDRAPRERVPRSEAKPNLTAMAGAIQDEATGFIVAGGAPVSDGARERRYRFKADYLPITKRQMKQSWRYLRKSIREGPPVEFDVEATVDKAAVEGRLYEPVMRPRRVNRAAMILLIDQEGSMTPFHAFSRRLEETAVRGGRLGQTNVYYFTNYPMDVLYCNPHFNESRPLETVIGEMHPTRTAVLIFSDAGAARDRYSYERVDMTRAFLRRLYQSIRYVAWLNPIPADRWPNSSAAAIARSVPMFEIGREGLQNAISVLRGRTITRR